jgi:glycosyltransferase involved in cell wall biosynthesis
MFLKSNFNLKVLYLVKRKESDAKLVREYGLENIVVFADEIDITGVNFAPPKAFLEEHQVLKKFYNEEWYRNVAAYLQENPYPLHGLIIEYIHLSYFLPLFDNVKKLIDTHDIMNIRNSLFKKNNIPHWIDIDEISEIKLLNEYDVSMCIQKKEYKYLKDHGVQAELVPHSIELKTSNVSDEVKNLIFIAGNSHANATGIKWFIENVWPQLDETLTLSIYGSVVNSLKEYKSERISLKGYVKDIGDVYANADIAINPVFVGGGLKIKNIEAMSNSVPLITSKEGTNGIESEANSSYILAITPEDWINAIKELVRNKAKRVMLVNNAISYMEKEFSPDVCYSPIKKILK